MHVLLLKETKIVCQHKLKRAYLCYSKGEAGTGVNISASPFCPKKSKKQAILA